jgi:hypothetical protein
LDINSERRRCKKDFNTSAEEVGEKSSFFRCRTPGVKLGNFSDRSPVNYGGLQNTELMPDMACQRRRRIAKPLGLSKLESFGACKIEKSFQLHNG